MVSKQQQLEWLAKKFCIWPVHDGAPIRMSSVAIGEVNNGLGVAHHIRMDEWQQEREQMLRKPKMDNAWHERGELPPVGVPVELWFGGSFAYNCEFIGMRGYNYVLWNLDDDKPDCADSMNSQFRPLRTEREKAIDDMKSLCAYPGSWCSTFKAFAESLYDAGYRKIKP